MKRSYYFLCFFLVFTSCKKTNTKRHLVKITAKNITVDSIVSSSKEIKDFVAPYKEKLTAEMQKVLSYAPKNFTGSDGKMQSSLGNLMADMCFDIANPIVKKKNNKSIDFVMFNHGGMRAAIPKGNVTKGRAFKLMPFENELVAVTLTGEKVMELVEYFIQHKRAHPLSKNIELTIKDDDYSLKINGKPFDKNKTYTILTSDFLQGGGDKMVFFKNPKELIKLNYKVRDAIINYFEKTNILQATIDNRIILE